MKTPEEIAEAVYTQYDNGRDELVLSLEQFKKDLAEAARTAREEPVPLEQWGTMEYGVFTPTGRPAESREDAERSADASYKTTPVVRKLITIDGEEFATEWKRRPTEKQFEEHPEWREQLR
jgi:hypothetical protein